MYFYFDPYGVTICEHHLITTATEDRELDLHVWLCGIKDHILFSVTSLKMKLLLLLSFLCLPLFSQFFPSDAFVGRHNRQPKRWSKLFSTLNKEQQVPPKVSFDLRPNVVSPTDIDEQKWTAIEQNFDQSILKSSTLSVPDLKEVQHFEDFSEDEPGGGALHGQSRRSCYLDESEVITLFTDGRPLRAEVEYWKGPDYIPAKMKLYSENGQTMPWIVGFTGERSMIEVRNTGALEFPFRFTPSSREALPKSPILLKPLSLKDADENGLFLIQGEGAIEIFRVEPNFLRVRVTVSSDGLPIQAEVQLLSGPNNIKQMAEIAADDGNRRVWTAVVENPERGSSLVIENTGPMEYPIKVSVEAIL